MTGDKAREGDEDYVVADDEVLAQEIEKAIRNLHVHREARETYDSLKAAEDWVPPSSFSDLAEGLAAPREPRVFLVDRLIIENGNVLITAGHKTGKTTLGWNLMRALCDDMPFLDYFESRPINGRVAYWDYELDGDYAYDEIAKIGIRRADRAAMLNLRGHSTPVESDYVAEWAVKWLRDRDTEVWVIDPFGAAFGGEENSNSEVRDWLKRVDLIKREAGVKEVVLITHTGRSIVDEGSEHSRGASRLEDWADVLWKYTRDTTDDQSIPVTQRYLTAFGRGVDSPEFAISFDHSLLKLTYIEGSGSRSQQRKAALEDRIIRYVAGVGRANTSSIKDAMGGKADYFSKALARLSSDGILVKEESGTSNYYTISVFAAQRMGLGNTGTGMNFS